MPGKCRPSLREKTLANVMRSNLSETDKQCIKNVFERFVDVVRCKDCKHWDCYGGEDSHKGDCLELEGLDCCMYEDDFCSYGERKKEDD